MIWCRLAVVASCLLCSTGGSTAESPGEALQAALGKLPLSRLPVGVTRQGTPIEGFVPEDVRDLQSPRRRLVLVGGLNGNGAGSKAVQRFLEEFYGPNTPQALRERWSMAAVPLARPDAIETSLTTAFPPPENGYLSTEAPEAQYLWRWLGIYGADAILEFRTGETVRWVGPGTDHALQPGELAQAATAGPVATLGQIPGWRLDIGSEASPAASDILDRLDTLLPAGMSSNRQLLVQRSQRSPLEVAQQLAVHYGHKLEPVEYLQGTAVIGRLRLSELLNDQAMRADVEKIAGRWIGKTPLSENSNGSNFAGHLIFAELAHRERNEAYVEFVRLVAERGFGPAGNMLPVMPSHSEMSDAVFMSTPIVVEAAVLSGDPIYYELAAKHLQYMLKLNLRSDGLHRHSPLDEAAWGRGNGFPALGLALCLDRIPEERPERELMLRAFQAHLAALKPHQDVTGMWHQVIDHPESYRELTATCMIAYAMLRGVQQGWLDDSYRPHIARAWQGLKLRMGADGSLFDVCTGTGKQKSLRDYYDRQAILGKDARGGAMSLLVATEYARYTQP